MSDIVKRGLWHSLDTRMPIFESWTGLGRTALVGVLAYAGLVLFLRLSGKRTLSKMNAFDFVVTIALGSTLASILVSRQTPLADGVLALALLIALQFAVAWLAVRSPRFRRLIKAEPVLLYLDGCYIEASLRHERVVRDEILAAVRAAGHRDMAAIDAVVLETDGTFSVLHKSKTADVRGHSTLANVKSDN